MEFQWSYFKSWKMMLWKCCTQYASKFGKLSSGHRPGEGQFSFQSQRRAMPKNAQTTAQLHSFHTLAKKCWKFSKLGFNGTLTEKFQKFKLDLERQRNQDHIANICWIIEKVREFQKNIYFCFIDYAKAFDCVNHNKLWKILQEMGIPPDLPLEKSVHRSRSNSRLVPNWKRSTSRQYIATLLI